MDRRPIDAGLAGFVGDVAVGQKQGGRLYAKGPAEGVNDGQGRRGRPALDLIAMLKRYAGPLGKPGLGEAAQPPDMA